MLIKSVNVGRPALVVRDGREYSTAINRRPVEGPVELTVTGFAGDRVADSRHHGGPEQAACCYPFDHYDYWSERLGTPLAVPSFGENLTTTGLLEREACIGDSFRIGSATVQITKPRQPCHKLAMKHNEPSMIQWVNETSYTGFYVRVLEPGVVTLGDEIILLDRPHPGLTVVLVMQTRIAARPDPAVLRRLATLTSLAADWREHMAKQLAERTPS